MSALIPSLDRDAALWKVVGVGSGILGALSARALIKAIWRNVLDRNPPLNPASPDTGWGEAVRWTAAVGVGAGIARLVARRGAASAWTRVRGAKPPVSLFSK